ncbi:bile acid:sodium symporter [Mycolicibacterium insubricum]|uniref:bile acid:sodium symporter n=1 Tax=Mycolicibacterium insubricum TaxID=444597 RepID=UPI0027E31681|nr:bile acid:sodium symporter [Mycolicibacterium insubricum]
MLYATFLQVPFTRLIAAFRDVRFLTAVLAINFVVVPVVVAALTLPLTLSRAVLLGVLLTLLTPCIDYAIVFCGLAGGDHRRPPAGRRARADADPDGRAAPTAVAVRRARTRRHRRPRPVPGGIRGPHRGAAAAGLGHPDARGSAPQRAARSAPGLFLAELRRSSNPAVGVRGDERRHGAVDDGDAVRRGRRPVRLRPAHPAAAARAVLNLPPGHKT